MSFDTFARNMISQKLRKAVSRCYKEMPQWYPQADRTQQLAIALLDKVTLQIEEILLGLDQEDKSDDKYIVKSILDFAIFKEGCRRYPKYLVEWEGYPKPEWEYDYNLNHCDEIDIFWMKVEYRQKSKVHGTFKFYASKN